MIEVEDLKPEQMIGGQPDQTTKRETTCEWKEKGKAEGVERSDEREWHEGERHARRAASSS